MRAAPEREGNDKQSNVERNISIEKRPQNAGDVRDMTESTSLLESPASVHMLSQKDAESTSSIEAALQEEAERPWPSTYGRSVSLLAGPHPGQFHDVDRMTRSPLRSVSPRMLLANRVKVGEKLLSSPFLPKKLIKHHSLGGHVAKQSSVLQSSEDDVRDGSIDLENRLMDAKAYRQRLLKQQMQTGIVAQKGQVRKDTGDHEQTALYSPGMMKERETDKAKKEAKMDVKAVDGKSTVSQCIFNMANILMGVGMLGLPFVFKSAGWIGGTLTLVVFGAVTWRTSIIIGRLLNGDPRPSYIFDDSPFKTPIPAGSSHKMARMRKPIETFPDIARDAFGDAGTMGLSIVLYFELFSCLAIFLVSLGEHMESLIPALSEKTHCIIMAGALTVPTAVLNTPRLLSYLSAVGTFATIAVVLTVVASAATRGDISEEVDLASDGVVKPPYHIILRLAGLDVALGLVAYCFSGHAIVPSIYTSMKEPQRYEGMVHWTFLIVMACCTVVGVSGYYMFGSTVLDQVTLSLAAMPSVNSSVAINSLTWLMVLTAFSKFTLTMFPLALGIEEIAAPLIVSDAVQGVASLMIRMVLIFLSLLVAIYVPSFSFLCSLVGLVCTMIVSVIFPAAAHLKLFGPELPILEKLTDVVFIVFGVVSAVVGTIATVG